MDSLKAGTTKVQAYDVTISDGHGGTDVETITITLIGADDAAAVGRARKARAAASTDTTDNTPGSSEPHGRHARDTDHAASNQHDTGSDFAGILGVHLNFGDHSGL
jgi:hypothetical protein